MGGLWIRIHPPADVRVQLYPVRASELGIYMKFDSTVRLGSLGVLPGITETRETRPLCGSVCILLSCPSEIGQSRRVATNTKGRRAEVLCLLHT